MYNNNKYNKSHNKCDDMFGISVALSPSSAKIELTFFNSIRPAIIY